MTNFLRPLAPRLKLAVQAAALAAAAFAGQAQAIVLFGTSAGGAAWNRPLAGNPPTGLSGVGTNTPYSATQFEVGTSGVSTFLSTSTSNNSNTGALWDNFTFLYQNTFSAAAPLSNVLIGNDDNPSIGRSGFNYSLTANTGYSFVTTGFSNADAGSWRLSITQAATDITLYGTTAGGSMWNRPLAGNPPTGLSGVGTNTPYSLTHFQVETSGVYSFASMSTSNNSNTGGLWDNFTFLYEDAFSAAAPLTNLLIGNDDNSSIGRSGFSYSLTANTDYFFVTTGFSNADAGTWRLSITQAVPEPETYLMMGFGLAAIALVRRRRRG